MNTALVRSLLVVALVYLATLVGLYIFQRNLVFAPSVGRVLPKDVGLSDVAEVTLASRNGNKLHSWYAAPPAARLTLLYMHGNGGSVGTRAALVQTLTAAGYGVFLVGYPGYGGSEGNPSEVALVESAKLAYDFLREEGAEQSEIVLVGQSLGSAVAVQLAAQRPARALILLAPMESGLAIGAAQYPFVPLRWLMRDPFRSNDHISGVEIPVLFIHGDADTVIPISSGQALFQAANEPKQFHTVAGAGHNNLYDYPILREMKQFTHQ